MKKYLILFYAVICYVFGIVSIGCYALFLANIKFLPIIGDVSSLSLGNAILVNVVLILFFALQHSIMARNSFKKRARFIMSKAIERSTFILMSGITLFILMLNWQKLPIVLFDFSGTTTGNILTGIYYFGWLFMILSTFQIDHFHFFGLKQAWLKYLNKNESKDVFKVPLFYQLVRHPIYLATIIFHWFTPVMTADRLILATGITIYIYIGILFEEEDLVDKFGRKYLDYSKDVPQLLPKKLKKLVVPAASLVLLFFITTSNKNKDTTASLDLNTGFTPSEVTLKEVKGKYLKELVDEQLVFVDSSGEKWIAPKGTLTDGASVPRLALWMTDGRFSEEFLKAAVIHDAYCQTENIERCPDQYRKKPWELVHRMFYEACLAGGTSESKAEIMFAAVWLAGPRWDDPMRNLDHIPEDILVQEFETCKKWIEKKNPSVDEIEAWMNKRELVLLAYEP